MSLWHLKYPQCSLFPNDSSNGLEISFSYLLFINFSPPVFLYEKNFALKTLSMQLIRGIWFNNGWWLFFILYMPKLYYCGKTTVLIKDLHSTTWTSWLLFYVQTFWGKSYGCPFSSQLSNTSTPVFSSLILGDFSTRVSKKHRFILVLSPPRQWRVLYFPLHHI